MYGRFITFDVLCGFGVQTLGIISLKVVFQFHSLVKVNMWDIQQ